MEDGRWRYMEIKDEGDLSREGHTCLRCLRLVAPPPATSSGYCHPAEHSSSSTPVQCVYSIRHELIKFQLSGESVK
ncbi:hypothetical protein B9Z55_026880 [Caenorhabditis nigoni]|uniref:Uncharacterized protein n=1 Tax=Caenorhabditis nigoni TaxID=1611254 RepID=A0A2G5SID0_9PELO|nr:hypothetical protein B9Z55_026880 [Caenorhabditis nigoni]